MSITEHDQRFDREKPAGAPGNESSTMDRRAQRTRQTLHETLMRLVVERGYDEISVSDIVVAANVGRSTFYAHFGDKDDLLRSMAGSLRAMLISAHAQAAADFGHEGRVLGFSRFMTEHLGEQHQLYRALMRGRAGPIMLELIRDALCDIVRKELAAAELRPNGPSNRELRVQFVVGAYMSVLTWWLDRGAQERPEDIAAAFRQLAFDGIGAVPGTAR